MATRMIAAMLLTYLFMRSVHLRAEHSLKQAAIARLARARLQNLAGGGSPFQPQHRQRPSGRGRDADFAGSARRHHRPTFGLDAVYGAGLPGAGSLLLVASVRRHGWRRRRNIGSFL